MWPSKPGYCIWAQGMGGRGHGDEEADEGGARGHRPPLVNTAHKDSRSVASWSLSHSSVCEGCVALGVKSLQLLWKASFEISHLFSQKPLNHLCLSRHFKPVRLSFCCWMQGNIFWKFCTYKESDNMNVMSRWKTVFIHIIQVNGVHNNTGFSQGRIYLILKCR